MKILKKLVSIISTLIFVVCLLLLAVVIITPKNADGTKTVNVAGYSLMSILTDSMEPNYNVGDIVIVKVTDAKELKVKDVITYYTTDPTLEGKPVTHRINNIYEHLGELRFETKGDNNPGVDSYLVAEDSIIGRVEYRIPGIGRAINFLQTNKYGFFGIVILPMLVIMGMEVRNIIKIARSGDEDESEEGNQ